MVSEKQAAAAVATERSLQVGEGSDDEGARYDAIVVGSGIGGLVAATQLAAKGARVLVLEKYIIPGGSSGYYRRDGFTFDVGSSVMFGFSEKVSETRYRRLISCACALDCVANAWIFRCALHSACYSEVWVSAILVCASSD